MLITILIAIKNVLIGVFVGGFLMFLSLKRDTKSFTGGTDPTWATVFQFIYRVLLFAIVVIFLAWAVPKVLL